MPMASMYVCIYVYAYTCIYVCIYVCIYKLHLPYMCFRCPFDVFYEGSLMILSKFSPWVIVLYYVYIYAHQIPLAELVN